MFVKQYLHASRFLNFTNNGIHNVVGRRGAEFPSAGYVYAKILTMPSPGLEMLTENLEILPGNMKPLKWEPSHEIHNS